MKFHSVKALTKYLEGPSKFRVYLVLLSDPYERSQMIDEIIKHLPNIDPYSTSRFSAPDVSLSQAIDPLINPSLFSGEPLVLIDGIDSLKKNDLQLLGNFLQNEPAGWLVLSAQSKQPLGTIYQYVDKLGAILDFSLEKPWTREQRFVEHFGGVCRQANKNMASDVLALLFERVGLDMASLEQEIEKLITYAGERTVITSDDVEKLCFATPQFTVWQIAEKIVWESALPSSNEMPDPSSFHTLVAALRYQLQMGYKLSSLLESGNDKNLEAHFPKVPPKKLEAKKEKSRSLGSPFFKEALSLLFEIDLLSKNNVTCYSALLELFCAKTLSLQHES